MLAPEQMNWLDESLSVYPDAPGFKAPGPSQEAARRIAAHAGTVRAAVLRLFVDRAPAALSADEAARELGKSILTVRPRVSELHVAGLLQPIADRARNADSGMTASRWRATQSAIEAVRHA